MEDTWRNRFFVMRKTLDLREGRDVPDTEFGARVAKRLNRDPYSSGSVSQWRSEHQIPPSAVQLAMCLEAGVDPGWFTYGGYSAAPAPPLMTAIDIGMATEATPHPARRKRQGRGTRKDYEERAKRTAKAKRRRAG